MTKIQGGWDQEQVAYAQYELTQNELQACHTARAFTYFRCAMEHIPWEAGWTLWDIGAGTGHYGTYIRENLSAELGYVALDASAPMVTLAKQRQLDARVVTLDDISAGRDLACGSQPQIVLHSQCVELTDEPRYYLEAMLQRWDAWFVLHKLRLARESRWLRESTYCGNAGIVYLWSRDELLEILQETGRRLLSRVLWFHEPIETWVVEPL